MASVQVFVYELSYYNNDNLLVTIDFNTQEEANSYNNEKNLNGTIRQKESYLEIPDPELRIKSFIAEEYKSLHISKLNFRQHLLPNVSLEVKDLKMSVKGRPVNAIYKYYQSDPNHPLYSFNGQNIAKIKWNFQLDPYFALLVLRQEILQYYYEDGTLSEEYIISSETLNPYTNQYDMQKADKERVLARENIINAIKAKLHQNVFAMAGSISTETFYSIILSIGNFFESYSDSLNAWIQTGSPVLPNRLSTETGFAFLQGSINISNDEINELYTTEEQSLFDSNEQQGIFEIKKYIIKSLLVN